MSNVLLFTTSPPPVVTLPAGYEIQVGTATSITPIPTAAGTIPDFFQWFLGSSCTAADAVTGVLASPGTYNTGVLTAATTYSVLMTDSSTGTPAMTSCASITITVENGPIGVATVGSGVFAGLIYATNPSHMSLTVIDSDSNTAITNIPLALPTAIGAVIAGTAVNPWGVTTSGTTVYVTGTATTIGVVCSVSIATNTVTACVQVGTSPEGVAVNSALGLVYVANSGDNTVSVLTTALAPVMTVPVGAGPMNVAVDPNTYNVWVTDNAGNTVSVLQPQAGTPITYAVTTVAVGFQPVGVAIYAPADEVLVANSGSGTVSVLSGTSFATIATIKVGGTPTGIDISGSTAYVANAATGVVTVINLLTNTPAATTIPVGTGPFGVAVDAPNGTVFVTNQGSNTVSVISLTTGLVVATIALVP
jgi:YVTN family beta-propeller protein